MNDRTTMEPQFQTQLPTEPQPQPQPVEPPRTSPQPEPVSSSVKKSSKLPLILTLILLVLAIAAAGYLGYQYKVTNDALASTKTELSETKSELSDTKKVLAAHEAADAFVATHNDTKLSRSSCNGQPLAMSDVHVNDKFVVYRYLCANTSSPILIGAFAKHKTGPTDFTYGSSPTAPNALPGYIYDSEPDFFGKVYGATRL